MNRRLARMVLLLLLVCVPGCTLYHHQVRTTEDFNVDDRLLPKLNITVPIAVEGQYSQSNSEIRICETGGTAYDGDGHEYTRFAVARAIDILRRNKVAVSAEADRKLTLSVSAVSCKPEAFKNNFIAVLSVTPGQASPRDFSGIQHFVLRHQDNWALSSAVLDAVLKMFEDESIRRYLEGV